MLEGYVGRADVYVTERNGVCIRSMHAHGHWSPIWNVASMKAGQDIGGKLAAIHRGAQCLLANPFNVPLPD